MGIYASAHSSGYEVNPAWFWKPCGVEIASSSWAVMILQRNHAGPHCSQLHLWYTNIYSCLFAYMMNILLWKSLIWPPPFWPEPWQSEIGYRWLFWLGIQLARMGTCMVKLALALARKSNAWPHYSQNHVRGICISTTSMHAMMYQLADGFNLII